MHLFTKVKSFIYQQYFFSEFQGLECKKFCWRVILRNEGWKGAYSEENKPVKVYYQASCQCDQLDLSHSAIALLLLLLSRFSRIWLCNPIDGSPPGSTTPGILQARTLEWVAIPFSNAWKWKVKVKSLSRVWLLATPWTEAHQAPPSMGFSRQECWSGVPLPSPAIALAVFNYPNWEVQKSIYQFLNCNWLRVSRSLNSWAMWVWPAYRKSCFPG